jgi:hypothetical protein
MGPAPFSEVVEAAAVPAPLLDALGRGLAAGGLARHELRCSRTGFRFESPAVAALLRRRTAYRARMAWGAAVGLWTLAASVHGGRMTRLERRLDEALQATAPATAALRDARRSLAIATMQRDSVSGLDERRGRLAVRLGRLAGAVPDSAWVTAITLAEDGTVRLAGVARPAHRLVSALERAGLGDSVDLEGMTMVEGTLGWERATIRISGAAR